MTLKTHGTNAEMRVDNLICDQGMARTELFHSHTKSSLFQLLSSGHPLHNTSPTCIQTVILISMSSISMSQDYIIFRLQFEDFEPYYPLY